MKTYFFDFTSNHIQDIDDILLDIFRAMARFMLQYELQTMGRKFGDQLVLITKCSNNRFMVSVQRVTKNEIL